MRSYGDINFQQNMIQQVVFDIETNFPANPPVGRLVFKDKVLWICAELSSGIPLWIPLTNEISTYLYTQLSQVSSWVITHGLNTTTPLVQIYDQATQTMTLPDNVTINDNNTVTVDFGYPMAGRAIVMRGHDTEGSARPVPVFEFTQASPSTSWDIVHNFGYYPIVRVFVGTSEIYPDTITHVSLFETIITFTTPKTGIARLV